MELNSYIDLSTMKLISHSLTPKQHLDGIQSLRGFGNPVRPLAQSVLYLRQTLLEASPKAISGRTSYIRVRLEFLRYPQLIPNLFNGYGSVLHETLLSLQPVHG